MDRDVARRGAVKDREESHRPHPRRKPSRISSSVRAVPRELLDQRVVDSRTIRRASPGRSRLRRQGPRGSLEGELAGVAPVDHRLHPEQVDTRGIPPLSDRHLHRHRGHFRMSVISSTPSRDRPAPGPSLKRRRSPARRPAREVPHLLGLDLYAGDGVHNEDRAVQDLRQDGVGLEVDIAGVSASVTSTLSRRSDGRRC